jgi:hypothetical protein
MGASCYIDMRAAWYMTKGEGEDAIKVFRVENIRFRILVFLFSF